MKEHGWDSLFLAVLVSVKVL